MLKAFCKDKYTDGVDFSDIVKKIPEKFTGAHLKEIYITACNIAVDKNSLNEDDIVILTEDILNEAVNEVQTRKEPGRIGFSKNE